MHLRTSRPHHLELAISQCRLGIPNENVTKPRLESFQDTCFNVFQIVPQHFCQKWDLLNHNYSTDSTSINHNFPHQHPLIQAEPPQRHNSNEKPSPLWRSLSPPEESPDPVRIWGCPDARGPADLLAPSGPCDRAPQPAGWVVVRWALCCDPQLVGGNVLVVQCGPLIVQTSKPANLRIWSARDGIVGTKKPGWRLLLDRVQSGTHDRCISQSSICIVTSCKTMLTYPCTKNCMYCCYDSTTQSNGLGPIWYLQPKLGFRRNSF